MDFRNLERGASARVAVELDPWCAREVAEAIPEILDAALPGLLEGADDQPANAQE